MATSRRRKRVQCIPGLVTEAFIKGSRHEAPSAPTLKKSKVDEETGECTFEWKAKGAQTYDVKATGRLEIKVIDDDDGGNSVVVGKGMTVRCSCPDGRRQAVASLTRNRIVVCKHGAAALESVLDEDAVKGHKSNVTRLKRQRKAELSQKKQREEEAKVEQETEMPGERSRIEYGLRTLSAEEIQKHLQESCKTVEGLRGISMLFPKSVVPPKGPTKTCKRCKKVYDEQYREQRICRMEHPEDFCEYISKWKKCYRCDGCFNVPHMCRTEEFNVGKWCFEGEHTQDKKVVKAEKWDADPADVVY